jgi:hypothetical protein
VGEQQRLPHSSGVAGAFRRSQKNRLRPGPPTCEFDEGPGVTGLLLRWGNANSRNRRRSSSAFNGDTECSWHQTSHAAVCRRRASRNSSSDESTVAPQSVGSKQWSIPSASPAVAADAPSSRSSSGASTSSRRTPDPTTHHLRQSRTLPTNHEEAAARPTRPTDHHRRAANPARPLPRRIQPAPPTPVPAPPRDTGHDLHRPPQGDPRRRPHQRHPRPGPQRQDQQSRHRHPCARPAAYATSATAEPTPEPTSCCSSTTSTSKSFTPPPAISSATSSSTPDATTNPPANHPGQPRQKASPDLQTAGPGYTDVLRHHTCAPGRIRTCDTRFRKPLLYPLSYGGLPGESPGQAERDVTLAG